MTYENNSYCNICLLQTNCLINTNDWDHNNVTWIFKMQSVVPELVNIAFSVK